MIFIGLGFLCESAQFMKLSDDSQYDGFFSTIPSLDKSQQNSLALSNITGLSNILLLSVN